MDGFLHGDLQDLVAGAVQWLVMGENVIAVAAGIYVLNLYRMGTGWP